MIVFIPVKLEGKTRLSNFLSKAERKELIMYMLKDILNVVQKIFKTIYIITNDNLDLNNVTILKDSGKGLRNVLEVMNKYKKENIFLPVDVPLIDEHDLRYVLRMKSFYEYIISPAKRNGISLVYRKNNSYDIIFSSKSFVDCLNYCKKNNINYFIYFSKNLYLDIDMVEDIYEFLAICRKKSLTYEFLRNIVKR